MQCCYTINSVVIQSIFSVVIQTTIACICAFENNLHRTLSTSTVKGLNVKPNQNDDHNTCCLDKKRHRDVFKNGYWLQIINQSIKPTVTKLASPFERLLL